MFFSYFFLWGWGWQMSPTSGSALYILGNFQHSVSSFPLVWSILTLWELFSPCSRYHWTFMYKKKYKVLFAYHFSPIIFPFSIFPSFIFLSPIPTSFFSSSFLYLLLPFFLLSPTILLLSPTISWPSPKISLHTWWAFLIFHDDIHWFHSLKWV